MSELYGVIGALAEPASRSGVTFGPCSHVAPDDCPRCDGQDAERWESAAHRRERESREATPPCLRPGFVPENQRTGGVA